MKTKTTIQRSRLTSTSVIALTTAIGALALTSPVWAQDDKNSGAGGEGAEVSSVVVTAERSKAAELAPTKGSVNETQPESIITQKFIEQATSLSGGWVDVAAIAPSVSGITSNGGGVGETAKLTMRGFQDGQFNLTYDGIAIGDTNGPTHHEASYFPGSTIGAVVVDRGPGAAGDLGPANFGGAIHYFSPEVSDGFGFRQRAMYGSFNTWESVTTVNTGESPYLLGGKLLLNFDERSSDGELSYSSGVAQNQLAKFILPLGPKWQFTLFGSHNYTRFYQNDGTGAGETWQQIEQYGKNFALTGTPGDEHYYKYNQQSKQTDFEYADIKGEVLPSFTVEDQLYTYFYTNKTRSASSNVDLIGSNASSLLANPQPSLYPGEAATDLQGYDKLNQYRVNGDILRFTKDFSFGTLKAGGLYEWSNTQRHNALLDITNGYTPDLAYKKSKYTLLPATTNYKTLEYSDFQDYQLFLDFYWRPTDKLTITPGYKYVFSHLHVDASDDKVGSATINKNQPLHDSANNDASLYFVTANYKLTPYWSVYGQFATSFLFPDISSLYTISAAANLQSLQPETTKTYQMGSVFSRGHFTIDGDIYRIDAANLLQQCVFGADAADCNVGKAQYVGYEAEAAYAFDNGFTFFGNFGSNNATQLANSPNATSGIAGNPKRELANSPRWTDAVGVLYNQGPIAASLTYRQSGAFANYNGNTRFNLPGYDDIDASAAYDFGHFKVKLQVFNLADSRAITTYTPASNAAKLYATVGSDGAADNSYYEYQAGRQVQVTLEAKF